MILIFIEWLARWLFNTVAERIHERRASKQRPKRDASSPDAGNSGVHIGRLLSPRRGGGLPEDVWLSFKSRLRGFLISGQLGAGKTNLIRLLLSHDLTKGGNGVFVLDPRGEFVDLILQILAERFTIAELKERLVLIDLRSRSAFGESGEWVVVYNPLCEFAGDAYAAVASTLNLLRRIWGELGVQIQYDFQHILLALTLSSQGPFSLLDVPRFLTDVSFRSRVLNGVTDEMVLRYVEELAHEKDLIGHARAVGNKITALFAASERQKATLGGTQKSYSVRAHIEAVEHPIILVCTAADEIDTQSAATIGSMLLSAAIKGVIRSDRPITEEPEQGMVFILDELAGYAAGVEEPLGQLAREGRKFGAGGVYSFQTPSSLSTSMRNLLQDVCGIQCFYAQSGSQADTVAGWVASDELPRPLVRQFLMQAKSGEALLLRQGHAPARMKTLLAPYPKVDAEKVRALRRAALEHWGVPPQTTKPDALLETSASATAATITSETTPAPLEGRDVDVETPCPKQRKKGVAK